MKICCICGYPFYGSGNNPDPVKNKGECCSSCNMLVVVPARIANLSAEIEKSKQADEVKK